LRPPLIQLVKLLPSLSIRFRAALSPEVPDQKIRGRRCAFSSRTAVSCRIPTWSSLPPSAVQTGIVGPASFSGRVPRIAMLSFFYEGQRQRTPSTEKVCPLPSPSVRDLAEAVGSGKSRWDGEMAGRRSARFPKVCSAQDGAEHGSGGKANVLIFPDLNSGKHLPPSSFSISLGARVVTVRSCSVSLAPAGRPFPWSGGWMTLVAVCGIGRPTGRGVSQTSTNPEVVEPDHRLTEARRQDAAHEVRLPRIKVFPVETTITTRASSSQPRKQNIQARPTTSLGLYCRPPQKTSAGSALSSRSAKRFIEFEGKKGVDEDSVLIRQRPLAPRCRSEDMSPIRCPRAQISRGRLHRSPRTMIRSCAGSKTHSIRAAWGKRFLQSLKARGSRGRGGAYSTFSKRARVRPGLCAARSS